jgi:hypothetical protein
LIGDTGRGSLCKTGWREPDLWVLVEALGKVGEQIGEDLSLAPLRPKDVGENDPLRSGFHQAQWYA